MAAAWLGSVGMAFDIARARMVTSVELSVLLSSSEYIWRSGGRPSLLSLSSRCAFANGAALTCFFVLPLVSFLFASGTAVGIAASVSDRLCLVATGTALVVDVLGFDGICLDAAGTVVVVAALVIDRFCLVDTDDAGISAFRWRVVSAAAAAASRGPFCDRAFGVGGTVRVCITAGCASHSLCRAAFEAAIL